MNYLSARLPRALAVWSALNFLVRPAISAPDTGHPVQSGKLDTYQQALRNAVPPDSDYYTLSVPPEARNAFMALVAAGKEGWDRIFALEFDVYTGGDYARYIDSLWNASDLPEGLVDRFQRAEFLEEEKRAQNETWALLYAQACERSNNIHAERHVSGVERMQKRIDELEHPETAAEPQLIAVAFLRVKLVERNDFPGHKFPWNGTAEEQAIAMKAILRWWTQHLKELDQYGDQ